MELDLPRVLQKRKFYKNKIDSTAESACKITGCPEFLDFASLIYELKYDEKPDYNKLRFLLTKILLDDEIVPSKKFDWNECQPHQEDMF